LVEDKGKTVTDDLALPTKKQPFHFLLTATRQDPNLCKTLLSSALLGYPSPIILAWQDDRIGGALGGGSHLAKISKALGYLESLGPEHDEDLVLMIDGYDIWFQLRVEVLVERYHRLNAEANDRLKKRLGRAFHKENIKQKIIFGAGKRCAPNDLWSVGCYAVPDSPIPADVYNHNTDTVMGHNHIYSSRQRYVNSGYVIGTIGEMRQLFTRANEMVQRHIDHPIYSGSDQAMFVIIFGQQEYQREVFRLQHGGMMEKLMHPSKAVKPASSFIQGTYIDNILNPSFSHDGFTITAGRQYEFGIGLDYFSDLGHQTMNSDIWRDALWLTYTDPSPGAMHNQIKKKSTRSRWDCKENLIEEIPADIMRHPRPMADIFTGSDATAAASWNDIPLYTHLCLGTIPVMVHHNGVKGRRERSWPLLWLQPHARSMLDSMRVNYNDSQSAIGTFKEFREAPTLTRPGGAWTDKGVWLDWPEMCPREYDAELYRDT